ncbi:MAG: hypothetical protein JRH20_08910 [Deltaproteobacteria bacterium]|nr:hypothetical protein [Deltaproteobacteria bacterium]
MSIKRTLLMVPSALFLACLQVGTSAAQPFAVGEGAAGWSGDVTPTPTQTLHTYARYRSRWYAGVGLGAGMGAVEDRRGFDQSTRFGPALSLRAGVVLRPWLLLGVEGSHWGAPDQHGWLQVYHADLVASLFLLEDLGFYLKVGVGGGVALLEAEDGASQRADGGVDVKIGLGYELQVGRRITSGLDLTFAHTSYSGGSVDHLCLRLTLGWY